MNRQQVIEQRRHQGEENYRRKFEEFGLSERFEFIRRDWKSHKGRRVMIKCKSCSSVFFTWALNDIFKGKQSHLLCLCCGAASDGNDAWPRSSQCDSAMEFYQQGHSVAETAKHFGVTKNQINNAVKARKITNGKDWREAASVSNNARHEMAVKKFDEYIKLGGKDYSHIWDAHKRRAIKYGCKYDNTVTLPNLIKRNGVQCAICGRVCDYDDHEWGSFGPTYPTIDHIVPMSKGGGHVWDNVQVACAMCNILKSDKEALHGEKNIQ